MSVDKIITLDSRDRVFDHSLSSDNTTSDFVVRLQEPISRLQIISFEIPIGWYAVNENSRYIYFRDPIGNYYQATLPLGNYDSNTLLNVLGTALNEAILLPLPSAVTYTVNTGASFTTTPPIYDETLNKYIVETDDVVGVQFITISDPDDPSGIPLGLVPGDITGINPVISPRRDTINNTARLLGLPIESVVPNPNISTDGFPIGVSFGFGAGSNVPFPNSQNISGDNYIYIRSDNVGTTAFKQGVNVNVNINESDFTVLQNSFNDNDILQKIQVNQIVYSVLAQTVNNPVNIFLSQATNEVNIRLTYADNTPVDLNGIDMSVTILAQ